MTIICVAAVNIAVAEIHRVVCNLGHDALSKGRLRVEMVDKYEG